MSNYKKFINELREMKSKNMGLMSEAQYMNIGYLLSALEPVNLLVFGLGGDSELWSNLNKKGTTVFLEDDSEWIDKFSETNLDIVNVKYTTFVGDHETINFDSSLLEMNLPDRIANTKWDVVIVDAPLGHGPPGREYKGPGRMQSIYTAHKLLKEDGICVVDDMKRLVEQKYALHYFGEENLLNVIEEKVAIFKKKEKTSLAKLIQGKKVALVGPAGYMVDSNYGDEIDSHDVVVRINRGIESIEKYSVDIGNRTDVYYSCLIERAQQTGNLDANELKNKYKVKHIVAPPDSNMKGFSFKTQLHSLVDKEKIKQISKTIPLTIVNHNFHTELAKKVDCKPNTGFLAIYDLLRMNPEKLSIYGFSFYLDGFIPGQKLGVQNEKNCTEQEFADMAFRSKRHVQKNMWAYAKNTLLKDNRVVTDNTLTKILKLKSLDRKLFKESTQDDNLHTD